MKLSNAVTILAATALVASISWAPVEARSERPRGDRSRVQAVEQPRGDRAERPERPARGERQAREAREDRDVREALPGTERPSGRMSVPSPGAANPMAFATGDDPVEAAARPYMRPFWQNDRIANALELNEEQVEALKTSHEEMSGKLRETFRAPVQHLRAIQGQLDGDSADLDAILESVDRLAENRAQRHRAILTHVVNVKNTLSADQEDRLRSIGERLAEQAQERPDIPERPRPQMTRIEPEVRREIGNMVRDGATPDEVREYLSEAGVDQHEIDRMVEGVRQMRQNRGGEDAPRVRENTNRRIQPRN